MRAKQKSKVPPLLHPAHATTGFGQSSHAAVDIEPIDDSISEERKNRRRRSSSVMYREPLESPEHLSDQSVLPNHNAEWVNRKGML